MMRERKQWIDICKGIAIILVVMGHIGDAYEGSLRIIHDVIYYFHMPLFMFVGGYLGSGSQKESFKQNCRKKILAYGVPYIVFSVVYWIFKMLGSAVVNNPTDIKELLLILIYPISFMWYIYALLFIVLLVELLKKHFEYYKQIILLSSILCYVVWLLLMKIPAFTASALNNLIIVDVIKNYIWYAIGYCVGDRVIKTCKYAMDKKFFAILMPVIGYSILFIVANINIAGPSLLNFVWGIIGIVCTIVICMMVEKNEMLEFCGRNTLPIYVLHGTVTSVAQLVFKKAGIENDIFLITICTLVGVALPLMAYEICKKVWWLDVWFYPNKYVYCKTRKSS